MTTSDKKPNEYALLNFKHDADDTLRFQPVVFYEKDAEGNEVNGTTLEEMLRVSIQRLEQLNGRFPCVENEDALMHMNEALKQLNKRTEDRMKRGVEGKLEA